MEDLCPVCNKKGAIDYDYQTGEVVTKCCGAVIEKLVVCEPDWFVGLKNSRKGKEIWDGNNRFTNNHNIARHDFGLGSIMGEIYRENDRHRKNDGYRE